jgi:glutamyl-tRNA reductase
MNLILVGMNHKTAPLEIRERLALSCGEGSHPLEELRAMPAVREGFYLATCNRVEVLAHAGDPEEAARELRAFVLRRGNLAPGELERCLYVYRDAEAVRHLFRVASSLDAMVMGEPQILGQVKEAYRLAVAHRATGMLLNRLLHHAFRVAKRVRSETGIAQNAASVSFAAATLAKKIFGGLKDRQILLVGAGEMSELAARHLQGQGAGQVWIANRTPARARELAETFQGRAVAWEGLAEAMEEADIVISSTGAAGIVITADMLAAALRRRRNRLLFLIDIAVPRDVDPSVGDIDNVFLYNIDDLQDIVDENMAGRHAEAQKAESIIAGEAEQFQAWYDTLEVVPTIVSLREKAEAIARAELERSSGWMQRLGDEERANVEAVVSAVVNKILHDPIVGLKEETQEGALSYVAAIRRLFKLGE